MKYFVLSTFFWFIIYTSSFCQTQWQKEVDSLLLQMSLQKEDSTKVITLITLGGNYSTNNLDSARKYYYKANDLADKINFNFGKMRVLASLAYISKSGQEALNFSTQGVALAKKVNNKHALAAFYNNSGEASVTLGNLEQAIGYYFLAMNMYENMTTRKDTINLGYVYANLVNIYASLEQDKKAYQLALKGISIAEKTKNNDLLTTQYKNFTSLLITLRKYDSATIFIDKMETLSKIDNNKLAFATAIAYKIDVAFSTNKLEHVLDYSNILQTLSVHLGDDNIRANSEFYKANFFFYKKKYHTANALAKKALIIILQKKLNTPVTKWTYQLLSDIALATGKIDYFKFNRQIVDSINNKNLSNKILRYTQELQVKYGLENKQTEIISLTKQKEVHLSEIKQKKIIATVLLIGFILFTAVGLLLYKNYSQKNKLLQKETFIKQQRINELEKEKQLHATKSILQGQEEERKRIAKDLHDGLGGILSSTKYAFTNMKNILIITPENAEAFDRSMAMLDKSISELRRVSHNMMPESLLNFGLDTALKDYCNSINQNGNVVFSYQSFDLSDESVSTNKASVIYRIVQELINNILKHAYAKNAMVQLIRNYESLSITVEDDGFGFDTAILQNNEGIGYLNLQNRVTYLKGTIDVQTAMGKGTSINIEIPNIS